jgi:hypothetical protein
VAESAEGSRLLSGYRVLSPVPGSNPGLSANFLALAFRGANAPIAQLDRASDYESEGRRFESCWAHHPARLGRVIRRLARLLPVAGVMVVALGACGWSTKHDVIQKSEGVTTRADLERALGKPDRFESAGVGPLRMETWVYRASDSEVLFVLAGDTVVSRTTGR